MYANAREISICFGSLSGTEIPDARRDEATIQIRASIKLAFPLPPAQWEKLEERVHLEATILRADNCFQIASMVVHS